MNKRLVPKLRFPEFDGEWLQVKLAELAITINSGKSKFLNEENGIYPIYGSTGILGFSNTYDYENNAILVARVGANAGYVYTISNRSNITDNTLIIILKTIELHNYIKFYLKKINLNKFIFGSGQPLITGGQLKKIEIALPDSSLEQTKIADFLTAVDDKIKQLTRKKELLEQYKKGVMQQIFSQKIRFKDDNGNDYPDWGYKFGNEIFETVTNKNHDSDLPVLAITQEYGAIPRDCIDFNISVTEKSVATYKVVDVGDFIISLRSFQGGIEYSKYRGICSPAYIILRNKIIIDGMFYKDYFKTNKYILLLNKNIEGIRDGKMVSYTQFSEIDLPYPSILEQTKIADFLASVDDGINKLSLQLQQTKTYKNSLLQQMFI